MKRKPEKNYKLPKYAAGLAAMLFAGSMTGCTDTVGEVQLEGDMVVPENTEYVELSGDVEVAEETCTEPETTAKPETIASGTEEVMLEGDLVIEPEDTCAVSEFSETRVEEFGFTGTLPAPPEPEELVIAGDIAME